MKTTLKSKLLIIGVAIMLVFIGMGGCDDFGDVKYEQNFPSDYYVNVIVEARVHVTVSDNFYEAPWPDALIDVQVKTSGGERENEQVNEQLTTDDQGNTSFIRTTLKAYREQYVEVIATVIGGPMPEFMGVKSWDPYSLYNINTSKSLSWSVIMEYESGGTHYWYPTVELQIFPRLQYD